MGAGPKKVYKTCGAPLYMSQFTMIMLILIVMCMLISVMTKEQESGFQEGDGMGPERRPNAMGIVIGAGVFKFGAAGKARSYSSNPGSEETDKSQNPHMDLMRGEGGVGNSDLNPKVMVKPKYFFVKLDGSFPPKSSALTPEINKSVDMLSTGLSYLDFDLTLKVFSSEFGQDDKDTQLAFDRGMKIIRELNRRYHVPLENMNCVAYTGRNVFMAEDTDKTDEDAKKSVSQEILFCLRIK